MSLVMTEAAPVSPLSYLAIGDSYTIGESVPAELRFPEQLVHSLRQRSLPVADPVIIARTGWTADELSVALDRAEAGATESGDGNGRALKPPYAVVTLLIGVNNQYRGRSAESFRPELRALLDRSIAYAGGEVKRVIVVSIPDWGATPFGESSGRDRAEISQQIDAYNAVNREEAAHARVAFIDITPGSREGLEESERVAADGLHPSGAEYARWSAAILDSAERALVRRAPLSTLAQ